MSESQRDWTDRIPESVVRLARALVAEAERRGTRTSVEVEEVAAIRIREDALVSGTADVGGRD